MVEQYQALARYNAWMNEQMYALAATLDDGDRRRDLGAFFGSLHGTLNHILWADRIWLWRFTNDATIGQSRDRDGSPIRIGMHDQMLYSDFADLRRERSATDRHIVLWAAGFTPELLAAPVRYQSMNGSPREHPLWMAVTHFFNHETHHRGQATTLLRQRGHDPGVTDFMAFLWAEMDAAPQAEA
ncbi:MAG: DinB family protein [Candidatus Binatia bacterium]